MQRLLETATDLQGVMVRVAHGDPVLAQSLACWLTPLGCEVTFSAPDCPAAVEAAAEAGETLLLAEPSESLVSFLMRRQVSCGIVLLPGGPAAARERLLRSGFVDHAGAPLCRASVEGALRRVLRTQRLCAQNVRLRSRLEDQWQVESEFAAAGEIQLDLLPSCAPRIEGYSVAAHWHPADEVGGDFFDWSAPHSSSLSFVVGDVMGKGMPAALLMASVRAAVRTARQRSTPQNAIRSVASALAEDFDRSGCFVTLFAGRLDAARGAVSYVDAGHGHAFVLRASGRVEAPVVRNLPLGVAPQEPFLAGRMHLREGDSLVVFTDGLVGPGRPDQETGALAERVMGCRDAEEIVNRLVAPFEGQDLIDDIAVLALRRNDGAR